MSEEERQRQAAIRRMNELRRVSAEAREVFEALSEAEKREGYAMLARIKASAERRKRMR